MGEEELTKEQKLEAARKKFEELKKKNKKGKKKGKNAKKDQSEEPKGEDEADDEDNNKKTSEVPEDQGEILETEDPALDSQESEITPGKAVEEDVKDATDKEISVVKEEEGQEKKESDSKDEALQNEEEVESKENDSEKVIWTTEEEKLNAETKAEPSNETKKDKISSLEDILSNEQGEESTFLTSTLQSSVDLIKAENEKLQEELRKIKAENVDLKLINADLEIELKDSQNCLETEKEKVKRLTQQLRITKVNAPHHVKSSDEDDGVSVLSGTEYLNHTTSSFQNLSSFNIHNNSQDYMDIVDLKERLAQWKGWNMDMHGWRSIGMGPVLDV
ncbi:hypothetical protein C6P42_001353 [Pichia californica]|nr:hypothetical protein C6P42_001353 [[Candida] californica]